MRKVLLCVVGLGLVALAFPTVQAGTPEPIEDVPATSGTCASVDRSGTDEASDANIEHPNDPDDQIATRAEVVIGGEDIPGQRVAVSVEVLNCVPPVS